MMNPLLNAAIQYERLGLSVIPLKTQDKIPLLSWAEFQKRRASESEIRKWWSDCPYANIGLVTGMVSGIAVVDLDGSLGIKYGVEHKLTSPMTSLTGRGRQLFYKYRE